MLKLYVMDMDWRGCIVVIAKNENDAREIMKGKLNYHESEEIEEFEIKEGFSFNNMGDS